MKQYMWVAILVTLLTLPMVVHAAQFNAVNNSRFDKNDGVKSLPVTFITATAAGEITAENDITIIIPAGIKITFEPAKTELTFSQPGASKVATTVTYSDDARRMTIDVLEDFVESEVLSIDDMQVRVYDQGNSGKMLQLDVTGDGVFDFESTSKIEVDTTNNRADVMAPYPVRNVGVLVTEEAHELTWDLPIDPDVQKVEILPKDADAAVNILLATSYTDTTQAESYTITIFDSSNNSAALEVAVADFLAASDEPEAGVPEVVPEEPEVQEVPVESEIVDTTYTHNLSIANMAFSVGSIEVNVGDTIVWTNNDTVQHTVVFDDHQSEALNKGDSFSYTFDVAGEFSYHCGIHPSMTGSITVVDPDAVVEEVFVEEVIEEETQKDTSHTNVVEPAPVNDVPESHWAHSEVGKVRSAGFMVAKKPGEFRLADSMSRAEAATVIAKALGSGELTPSPTDTPSAFSDIAQDAWYAPYVAFVLERDIVELRDTFEPVRQINRAELYVMIMKARGIEIDETGATDHFSDIPGGTWFDTVAAAAFKAGLAQGKPRGSAFYFAGGENVTRAEAAVMLSKAFLDNM